MKIRAKWGFIGDIKKLRAKSARVQAKQVFDNVDDEYAAALIEKGLVEEVKSAAKPKGSKQTTPKENK